MTFKNSLIPRMVLSCVDVKQFGTLVGDKSQNLGDKSQQPVCKTFLLPTLRVLVG